MGNAQKYMELDRAASRATNAWLANDCESNFKAMCDADAALAEAKAAGWNRIEIAGHIVDGMMARSVFGNRA